MEESQKSVVADRVAVGGGSAGGVKYSKTGEVEDDKMLDKSVSAGGETNVRIKKLGRIDEAADHQKPSSKSKDGSLDIHLDLEKTIDVKKLNTQQHLKQQQPTPQKSVRDDASADKSGQSSSLQLQMSATAAAVAAAAAGWPGGIPPMGYVAPLQGVVPMDGSTMAPPVFQPPHFLFSQPRPKRCATHCYVAKNIQCHQQFLKMNSFWPAAAAAAAAAGSAPLFGTRPPYNLNMVPAADLHGNAAGRSANPAQEKGQGQAITFFPGQPSGTEKVPPAGSGNAAGAAQKKQFLLPQSLPPGAPANIMHGPFLFPLGQQQAATTVAAASATACPPGMLTVPAASAASTSGSASTPVAAATSVAAGVSPAMSFNFPNMPNMPGNETQYLAILGNSAYPFPFPAHVGAPTYGGAHAQAMPFFNGSFYPSQMLHPSQLQAAQQPLQGHQITNVPNAASSSQKHMQNQQRTQGGSTNGGSSNPIPQSFPASKNRATQPPQHEMGGEDSPSTADSRASRQNMGVYGTNFTLPIHPPNFFLTPAALVGSTNASGSTNHGEKKQHHQSQQAQALKSGMESMTPPAFTMSFASINGTASGFDISTMAQNHAIFQSLPPGARNHQMMAAAAQAAQQKKSYRPADDGKAGGADSSNGDEEMKSMAARASTSGGHGQSIAFSRSDMPDTSVPTMAGNNVVDSSARSFNLLSSQPCASRSSGPTAIGNASGPNSQQQQHQQQQMQQQQFQQQQQRLHLQKQHQAAAATRGKTSTTSNGNAYMDHHLSSSSPMPAKFPSGISGFPPSIVQNSSSPSPQVSSSSIPVSASAAMKNLPQQKSRPQQGHTQISFGTNQKPTAPSQPQQMPSSHQAPSSPMMVGSPSTSSLSKSAGGSPRTTASGSTGNKISQASSHPPKNSSVVQNQKSSPVGGRNAQSILGSPHISTSTGKPQLQQQQHPQHQLQQPQLSRQAIQQTQLYFSNAYPQPPHNGGASSATATASGYYLQKHRSEHPQQGQKSHGSGRPTSSGIMSLSPVSLVSTSTTDPAKAVAAAATATAASSMKMPSPAVLHGTQFSGQPPSNMQHQMVPAGFSYVPAADQVKPAEQKQPAGNDNLHSSWQPERK
ncbi:TIME FOR COFFEE-like protein [Drosera capensis]